MTLSKPPVNSDHKNMKQERDDAAFFKEMFPSGQVPQARSSLKADILAGFDDERRLNENVIQSKRGILEFIRQIPFLQKGALAGAGLLGLAIGIVAPTNAGLLPEDEIYMYSEETTGLFALADEEYDQWIGE